MVGRVARLLFVAVLLASGAMVVMHLLRGHVAGRQVEGGILIGNPRVYDLLTRFLLGPYYRRVAADIAASVPAPAKVLELGCGPGHLTRQLAAIPDFEVTGLDLDPQMIERAKVGARSLAARPTFVVGDAAALPFADGTFDLVVSTFSMHHWSDPAAGLKEIARVLRPGGEALIWDFGGGSAALHAHAPDPTEHVHDSQLELVAATPWRWPLGFAPTQRLELRRP